jgi:hypothetical protein
LQNPEQRQGRYAACLSVPEILYIIKNYLDDALVLFLVTWTKILSLFAVAYFLAGMFIAAILSIPSWLLKFAIARRITYAQALKLRYFWIVFERAYNFAVPWCLFSLYKRFIS